MSARRRSVTLLVFTCNFPAVSETFINAELRELRRRGWPVKVINCYPVSVGVASPELWALRAGWPVESALPLRARARCAGRLLASPRRLTRVLACGACLVRRIGVSMAARAWRAFVRGLLETSELESVCVYAHYVSTPAAAASLLAAWRGEPFVASAHGADVYKPSPATLQVVLHRTRAVVTCSAANRRHLQSVTRSPVNLIPHGVDGPARMAPPATRPDRFTIVTVARFVPKKAHDDLIAVAAGLVEAGTDFAWEIVGWGALEPQLREDVRRRGLDGRIRWRGALQQDACLRAIAAADVLVSHSVAAADGDRDSMPNVLKEALALGTRVLTSPFPGAIELQQRLPRSELLEVCHFSVSGWSGRLSAMAAEPPPTSAARQHTRDLACSAFDLRASVDRVEAVLEKVS